ncbi:MAG: ATP-binding protein [Actinomycetes bacterium]
MALLMAASGIAIYWVFRTQVLSAVDAGMASRTDQIIGTIDQADRRASLPVGGGVIESDEAFAQVLDASGAVIDSSAGVGGTPIVSRDEIPDVGTRTTFSKTVSTEQDSIPSRLLVTHTDNYTIVVGASLEDVNDQFASLVRVGLIVGVLAIALTGGVGWLVAGAALKPVESMRQQTEDLSARNLHERLDVPNTRDELGRLARTLNSLLADIEDALERERTFMGQASHELRTPLANLKAEVDIALRRERGESELRLALVSVAEEVDRLVSLAAGLLDLARLGQGQWSLRTEDVEPHDVVSEQVLRCRGRAQLRGVRISLNCRPPRPAGAFRADRQRLAQVVSNLLDNAIAHSPSGTTVTVTSDRHDGWTLKVVDEGPGFPDADAHGLVRPFASDVTHEAGSAGLGLSIVQAIVDAHDGSLTLKNCVNDDGTRGGALAVVFIPSQVL